MANQETARGILLAGTGVFFLVQAVRYPIGTLQHIGSGLFPAAVAIVLLALSVAIMLRSRFMDVTQLQLPVKKAALVIAGLVSFALLSEFGNMILGIIALVTIVSLASEDFSIKRTAIICVALCLVAIMMVNVLGVQLPIY